MIYGIGTDICDVRRIRASLARHGERFAEKILENKGARVTVFDKDPFQGKPNRPQDIVHFPYVMEATPQPAWIHSEMLAPDALIVAPGIPLGLDPEAAALFKEHLVHDMLDIGTATMLAMAL